MTFDPLDYSVTHWIAELKAGNEQAANEVWDRYFERLVAHAQVRLGNASKRIADEEDIAVSVFRSLCDGAARGQFNRLANREDLWKLLVAITGMKVVDQIRRQTALKRGGNHRQINSHEVNENDAVLEHDQFLASEPTPEFIVAMQEEYDGMMDMLPDPSQRDVAKMRMDGYLNEEIAEKLGISLRSVERKLQVVRDTWMQRFASN